MNRLIFTLILLLAANIALAADAPVSKPASQPTTQTSLHATIEPGLYWNLLRTELFGIGIPQKWDDMPQRPNSVLHIAKRDLKDETRQPLEVGLMIERMAKGTRTLDEAAKHIVEQYQSEKTFTIEGKPQTEHVKLADGSDAVILSLQLYSQHRRAYMQKLLAIGHDRLWVISGYIIAGEQSILIKPDSDMARKLRAHLQTFTLDPNKLDQNPLNRAYLTPQQPPAPTSQPKAK